MGFYKGLCKYILKIPIGFGCTDMKRLTASDLLKKISRDNNRINKTTSQRKKNRRIYMEAKDWILLLVPIFCNGVTIFILQKIFEKKQITRTIKFEYGSILRQKIDLSLELHAKATRLANEENNENDNMINETIPQYVNSILDVYYYFTQNKIVFKSLEKHMEQMAALTLKLINGHNQKEIDSVEFCSLINKISDELMSLKEDCIKLHF